MGIWQKRLGSGARWWNTEIKVNPAHVHEQMGHPVHPFHQVTAYTEVEVFVDEKVRRRTKTRADQKSLYPL